VEGNLSDPLKFASGLPADRPRQRSTEKFFNDADGHLRPRRRVHPQIAWTKLRDGAAVASEKLKR
jgi:hypothetical protein